MKTEMLKFERIRNLREERDLTQQKVADYLAVFYDVSMDYLVGLTDDPTPPKRTVKKEGAG